MSELEKLYKELEKNGKFDSVILNYDYTTEEQNFIQKEYYAFFGDYTMIPQLSEKDKAELSDYYKRRYLITKNIFLKARYAYVLYYLTHNREWYKKTIDSLKLIIKNNEQNTNEAYYIENIVNCLIKLSCEQKKTELPVTKDFLLEIIKNANYMLQLLIIVNAHKSKLFNKENAAFIVDICIKAAMGCTEYILKKQLLDEGIYYAKKDTSLNNRCIQMFEMLGDNEEKEIQDYDGKPEHIFIPHHNQSTYKRMMEYYKLANNKQKLERATSLFNKNKPNLEFPIITNRVLLDSKVVEYIYKHFDCIKSFSSKIIFIYLCSNDKNVFMPDESLQKTVNAFKSLEKLFRYENNDINLNSMTINDKNEFIKMELYGTGIRNNIKYILEIILSSIKDKKISYTKIRIFLEKYTIFGCELGVKRNDISIKYTLWSMIDFGIKDLFKQFSRYVDNKDCDWRIPIDILSLKFEGILRDLIGLHCGVTTKIDNNGNTTEMLLDELLRSDHFLEIFTKDDLNLFYYVFTSKGLNIRNSVAHGFYKQEDYTMFNAVLVFLCILRLAKFGQKK